MLVALWKATGSSIHIDASRIVRGGAAHHVLQQFADHDFAAEGGAVSPHGKAAPDRTVFVVYRGRLARVNAMLDGARALTRIAVLVGAVYLQEARRESGPRAFTRMRQLWTTCTTPLCRTLRRGPRSWTASKLGLVQQYRARSLTSCVDRRFVVRLAINTSCYGTSVGQPYVW